METITTLTGLDTSKRGTSKRGAWTLWLFDDGNGFKCQTFDDGLGQTAQGLLNRPARIVYEPETNGDFTNNIIKAVEAAGDGAATATQTQPTQSTPVEQQPQAQPSGVSAKDEQIHRQVAAKVSAALLPLFPPEQQTTSTFWILIDDLVHFFNTGQHQG